MPDGTGLTSIMERWPERLGHRHLREPRHGHDGRAGEDRSLFFAVHDLPAACLRPGLPGGRPAGTRGPARLDRAGCVGGDGAVHQGRDIALLCALQAALLAPCDESSPAGPGLHEGLRGLRDPLSARQRQHAGGGAFRGRAPFEHGKAWDLVRHDQPDVAVLVGTTIDAIIAPTSSPGTTRSRSTTPLREAIDAQLIRRLCEAGVPIITVEDHGLPGGQGAGAPCLQRDGA